jgi:hypothetical protein
MSRATSTAEGNADVLDVGEAGDLRRDIFRTAERAIAGFSLTIVPPAPDRAVVLQGAGVNAVGAERDARDAAQAGDLYWLRTSKTLLRLFPIFGPQVE